MLTSFCPLQVIHDVHIEPAHIVRKRSIDQPLRILLYYDESVYRFVSWLQACCENMMLSIILCMLLKVITTFVRHVNNSE
jgi:hypothetical protein